MQSKKFHSVEIRDGSETTYNKHNYCISLDFLVCSLYFAIHLVIGFMYTVTVALKIFWIKVKDHIFKLVANISFKVCFIRLISKAKKFE